MIMLYLISFLLSAIFTYFFIKYPWSVADPSIRGMHSIPKPTSGGLGIFISILLLSLYLEIDNIFIFLLIFISLIGLLDDKYSIGKVIRLISQLIVPIILLYYEPMIDENYDLLLYIIIMISIAYIINIFNFMDGIDLIVSNQTVFILSSLILLSFNTIIIDINIKTIMLLTLFSILGFSIFNFSPSKIFLGNIGSYLIGFIIAYIFYKLAIYNSSYIFPILILSSVFIVETLFALSKRFISKFLMIHKDNRLSLIKNIISSIAHITEAHCTHNYQILAKKYGSHSKVNVIVLVYNLFWCLPLSYLVLIVPNYSLILTIICFIPYMIWCYYNQLGDNR